MRPLLKPIDVAGRKLMQLIDKDYLKKKLDKRQGTCKKCGECCRGCLHLNKTTKLCKIYEKRPIYCYKEFPLDKLDQKIWNVKNCGYRFENKENRVSNN